MITKEVLFEYVWIISGYDVDPNLTLVDFSFNDEKRKVINLVNNEAKKDKKLANLLEELKYSNDKKSVIEKYFDNQENTKENSKQNIHNVGNHGRINANNYGFIDMTNLASIIAITASILTIVITFGTRWIDNSIHFFVYYNCWHLKI